MLFFVFLSVLVSALTDWYIFAVYCRPLPRKRTHCLCWLPTFLTLLFSLLLVCGEHETMGTVSILLLCVTVPKTVFAVFLLVLRIFPVFRRNMSVTGCVAGAAGLFVLGSTVYGATEGIRHFEVNDVEIYFASLPESFDGYRIVQISDIHSGSWNKDGGALREAVSIINGLDADIVLFTGDIVNSTASELLGTMDIADIVLENSAGRYEIGDVDIDSYFGDELYRMKMGSSFADISFAGSAQVTQFVKDLKNITLKRELPALFRDTTCVKHTERYRINYRNKNSMDLLAFLSPGLYISDSTTMVITVDTLGVFRADLKSPRIAYNENYIRNMEMRLNNINGSLTGEITGKTINAATLALENNSFKMFARNNFIGFGCTYENPGDLINRGEIFITGNLSRDEEDRLNCHVRMLPSRVFLNSREWSINPSSLDIRGKDIDISKIEFTSGDQAVRISGGCSESAQDTLTMRLERFDISIINPLLKNRYGIEGAVTGEATIISPMEGHGIMFDFLADSTRLAGADVGTLKIKSKWNEGLKRFDAAVENEINGKKNFGISGNYTPATKNIDAAAVLSGMDISYAGPFLKSVFSDISGHISGEIRAKGPVDALQISSENARIDDSRLTIAFTNVPYNASGAFHIDDEGVHFDDIVLSDRFGNTGKIAGGIKYDRLRDIELDAMIEVTDMECLNTTEDDNSSFYGNLSASGNLALTGPLNAVRMDVRAVTSGEGQLHIPIPSSATAMTSNLLTFKHLLPKTFFKCSIFCPKQLILAAFKIL